jgi:hypothetical protein
MHWVTTRGVKINRAATAWLIRRFIDPQASFVFTAAGEVAEIARALGGVGFHAPGTPYPARDPEGRTPFEALVAERRPDDEVLAEMAVIVRHADRPPDAPVPEAAGLRLISGAFPLVARDDHETLERSAFLYDALYAALAARPGRKRTAEGIEATG